MMILIVILISLGALWGLYFWVKSQGRQEVINESQKEAIKDGESVKKRDLRRSSKPVGDIIDKLHQDTRD